MKFTNIAGATGILEHNGKRFLFDPWLDPGIFFGSWHHFPPSQMKLQDLPRVDYVFISHIHEDHCSPGTIKHINRDAEIILMDKKPNYVLKFLEANKFNFKKVHLIPERSPTEIADGIIVDMIGADPAHHYNRVIDSGLILKWDDFVLYNANDCDPYAEGCEYIKENYPKIDFALLPYAGGSGYPACYSNLSHSEKIEVAGRIRNRWLQEFITNFECLKPRYTMPFANQYVIGGKRAALNQYLAHPPSPGSVFPLMKEKGYEKSLILLNSLQTFDFDLNRFYPDAPYQFFSEKDRDDYIEKNLLDWPYEHEKIKLNTAVSIERLLDIARERLWSVQKREGYFPDTRIYFEIKDRNNLFELDFTKEKVVLLDSVVPLKEPFIKMSLDSTLFAFLLIGHMSWNMADAALLIDYERRPDIYDTKVYTYINFLKV